LQIKNLRIIISIRKKLS